MNNDFITKIKQVDNLKIPWSDANSFVDLVVHAELDPTLPKPCSTLPTRTTS
jgi:hypothetical protein